MALSRGTLLRCIRRSHSYCQLQVHRNSNTIKQAVHYTYSIQATCHLLYWSHIDCYFLHQFYVELGCTSGSLDYCKCVIYSKKSSRAKETNKKMLHEKPPKFPDDLWWHYRVTIMQIAHREEGDQRRRQQILLIYATIRMCKKIYSAEQGVNIWLKASLMFQNYCWVLYSSLHTNMHRHV